MDIKDLKQKTFSNFLEPKLELTDLLKFQVDSYDQFLNTELKEIFEKIFPVEDANGRFIVELVDCSLKKPKLTEDESLYYMTSYTAPFHVRLRLINNITKKKHEDEILFADIPVLTKNKSFIINGIERTIISQIVRASGVRFFSSLDKKGNSLFNSEIRPIKGKGVWVFFESNIDGTINVKLDQSTKKIPVTSFLKIFGPTTQEEIFDLFKGDRLTLKVIENTFENDPSETMEDVWKSIYKAMKGVDVINSQKAEEFIKLRFSKEYFDLSEYGRIILNNRSGRPIEGNAIKDKSLTLDDVVFIIKEIVRLNSIPNAPEGDIDSLTFKKIRSVGELLSEHIHRGVVRLKRNLRDKMITQNPMVLESPIEITNIRIFETTIQSFFVANELSQTLKQTNVLDELEHFRTISAIGIGGVVRERAGIGVRNVHPSHYGRLCPVHTPEGGSTGLVLHLALYARLNKYGLIEVPYAKIKNGKITNIIEYLTADKELEYKIAAATSYTKEGKPRKDKITVRHNAQFYIIAQDGVDYVDVSTGSVFSVATCLIPFVLHDTPVRAVLGTKMQRQALSLLNPEPPLIATGFESKLSNVTNRLIVAEENGEIIYVDAVKIILKGKKDTHEYNLKKFKKSANEKSFANDQTPCIKLGQKVKKGEVIADISSTINGQLALGKNLRVGFMTYNGLNFEDAIIISKKLLDDDILTSIEVTEYICRVRETKLGEEISTADIPNISEHRLRNLSVDGVISVGSYVKSGDVLVGKLTPRGESQLTPEEKLLQSIFGEKSKDMKNTPLVLPSSKKGRVINVDIRNRDDGFSLSSGVIQEIKIVVAELRAIQEGDKLANRHANKGVISKVLPVEDMPFTEDGEPLDVLLTPLGVPSRQNPGQIIETHLGLAAHKLGYQAIIPPLTSVTEEELQGELEKAGYDKTGKLTVYNGQTGEKLISKVTVGYMYIMKLNHLVEDKFHARSTGPYTLVSRQPPQGKARFGGQRVGEMEVWAFLGHAAAYTLREMLTIKSDDEYGRYAAYNAIIKGIPITQSGVPVTFNVLIFYLRALGLNMEFVYSQENKDQLYLNNHTIKK